MLFDFQLNMPNASRTFLLLSFIFCFFFCLWIRIIIIHEWSDQYEIWEWEVKERIWNVWTVKNFLYFQPVNIFHIFIWISNIFPALLVFIISCCFCFFVSSFLCLLLNKLIIFRLFLNRFGWSFKSKQNVRY